MKSALSTATTPFLNTVCPGLIYYPNDMHALLFDQLVWKSADPGALIVPPGDTPSGLVGVLKGQVGLKLARSGRLIDLGAAGFWCGRANPIALTPENLFVEARLPTNMVVLPSTRVRALLARIIHEASARVAPGHA